MLKPKVIYFMYPRPTMTLLYEQMVATNRYGNSLGIQFTDQELLCVAELARAIDKKDVPPELQRSIRDTVGHLSRSVLWSAHPNAGPIMDAHMKCRKLAENDTILRPTKCELFWRPKNDSSVHPTRP